MLWKKLRFRGGDSLFPPLGMWTPGLSPVFCGHKSRKPRSGTQEGLDKGLDGPGVRNWWAPYPVHKHSTSPSTLPWSPRQREAAARSWDLQILILNLPGIRSQVLGCHFPMFSHLCSEMTDYLGDPVLPQSRKLSGSTRSMPPPLITLNLKLTETQHLKDQGVKPQERKQHAFYLEVPGL